MLLPSPYKTRKGDVTHLSITTAGRNVLDTVDAEVDWNEVFNLRCRAKRGEHLSPEEHASCTAAWKADPGRYSATEANVFNATLPFGSTRRMKETRRSP